LQIVWEKALFYICEGDFIHSAILACTCSGFSVGEDKVMHVSMSDLSYNAVLGDQVLAQYIVYRSNFPQIQSFVWAISGVKLH
jgi:hypothetical protein